MIVIFDVTNQHTQSSAESKEDSINYISGFSLKYSLTLRISWICNILIRNTSVWFGNILKQVFVIEANCDQINF